MMFLFAFLYVKLFDGIELTATSCSTFFFMQWICLSLCCPHKLQFSARLFLRAHFKRKAAVLITPTSGTLLLSTKHEAKIFSSLFIWNSEWLLTPSTHLTFSLEVIHPCTPLSHCTMYTSAGIRQWSASNSLSPEDPLSPSDSLPALWSDKKEGTSSKRKTSLVVVFIQCYPQQVSLNELILHLLYCIEQRIKHSDISTL